MMNFLRNVDRRWIFMLMGVAVALPILLGFLPPNNPTLMDRSVFDAIEDLPDGSRVLVSFDFDPGSQGELLPMAMAFTRHCGFKRHKVYFMCLWPLGEPFIEDAMKILDNEFDGLEYGEDYMSFGYKPGGEAVIKNIIVDWKQLFITDSRKQSLDDIPMTANIKSAKSMDLMVNVCAGDRQAVGPVRGDTGQHPVGSGLHRSAGTAALSVHSRSDGRPAGGDQGCCRIRADPSRGVSIARHPRDEEGVLFDNCRIAANGSPVRCPPSDVAPDRRGQLDLLR